MSAIDRLLQQNIKLPSPPAIAVRILDVVKKDGSSFKELSKIISADPALTAKILKLANSSLYSTPSKVDSLDRALSLIGIDTLKNIALSFVIAGSMKGSARGGFDFDLFWKRAITAAVGAELLSSLLHRRNDDTFVTALLQDIGVLVLFTCRPEEYLKVLDEKNITGQHIHLLEKEIFGFDHQQLGAEILKRWGLPDSIALPIGYHHQQSGVPAPFGLQAEILFLANNVSSAYHGMQRTEKIKEITEILGKKFGIDQEGIDRYIDSVAEKSIEILSEFELDPGDMKPYSQLLQEANEELGKLNLTYEQLVMELKQAKEEAETLARSLKEANARLRELATRDGLTGLYNHKHFQEVMDKELSGATRYRNPLSLIMFDIDHFKGVNDRYGHPRGDIVLKAIAGMACNLVRECDIVARYGGEEFALILPSTDGKGASVLAERFRLAIEALEIEASNLTIKVTISSGVTTYIPRVSTTKKALLIDTADKALYQSKEAGRNRVTFIESPAL